MVDFINGNLLPNAVEGVDLIINGNVWVGFSLPRLGSSIRFLPSKGLIVVVHQPSSCNAMENTKIFTQDFMTKENDKPYSRSDGAGGKEIGSQRLREEYND